jgi:hypothetical protein
LTAPAQRGRAGERGLVRGCCAGLIALIVVVAVLVLLLRVTGDPGLGAPPAGPDDGGSPAAIAGALGAEVETELGRPGARGAVVLVSEQDLSTLAAADNPDPDMFTAVKVRARGAQLWVSADSHLGPLAVLVTARITLSLRPGGQVTPTVEELDVGDQAIPGFMQSAIDPRGDAVLSFASLVSGVGLSRYGLECLVVMPGRGVELGFHAPLLSADPGYCAANPLPEAISEG